MLTVGREAPESYLQHLRSHKFCLLADGVSPWSTKLLEYLAAGCVPVLISDHLIPPLHRTLQWEEFAVSSKLAELPALKSRLQTLVADGSYERLHANVLRARAVFVYDMSGSSGHAAASGTLPLIVYELSQVSEQRGDDGQAQPASSTR